MDSKLQELRAALIGSGKQIIRTGGAHPDLDIAAVAHLAGLSEATFRQCFETRSHYLVALIESVLDELRDEIVAATAKLAPGMERVWQSIECYLEGNLKRPYMRALIQDGRFDPLITEMSRRRTYGYGMLMNMEFASIKVRHAAATGRLFAVMAVDLAVAEYEASRALPDQRETLYSFLKHIAAHGAQR